MTIRPAEWSIETTSQRPYPQITQILADFFDKMNRIFVPPELSPSSILNLLSSLLHPWHSRRSWHYTHMVTKPIPFQQLYLKPPLAPVFARLSPSLPTSLKLRWAGRSYGGRDGGQAPFSVFHLLGGWSPDLFPGASSRTDRYSQPQIVAIIGLTLPYFILPQRANLSTKYYNTRN
jgi:hypothetical protein